MNPTAPPITRAEATWQDSINAVQRTRLDQGFPQTAPPVPRTEATCKS